MKTKKLGTIVELDPTKKYLMLIDADMMAEEEAMKIVEGGIRDGMVIYAHKIREGVTFVENSDKIVEVKINEN